MGLSEEGLELKDLCHSMAREVDEKIRGMVGEKASGQTLLMGADGTPTKQIDRTAEDACLEQLRRYYRGFRVLSEERGEMLFGAEPQYCLYLDPLDGTFNAVHGIPFYSVSIFIRSEAIRLAYVYDLAHSISFYSEHGKGSYSQVEGGKEHRLSISTTSGLEHFSLSAYTLRPHTGRLVPLADLVRRIRTLGSTSIEMCYMAAGKLDAFLDLRGKMRLVDVAAGIQIIQEAGGVVTDLRGCAIELNLHMWQRTDLIATNGLHHGEILDILSRNSEGMRSDCAVDSTPGGIGH